MIKIKFKKDFYGAGTENFEKSFPSVREVAAFLTRSERVYIDACCAGFHSWFDGLCEKAVIDGKLSLDNSWKVLACYPHHNLIGALASIEVSRVVIDGKTALDRADRYPESITDSGYEEFIIPLIAELKKIRGL